MTEIEKRKIRKQLRDGNRLARETAKKRGIKLHPKIAAKKATG